MRRGDPQCVVCHGCMRSAPVRIRVLLGVQVTLLPVEVVLVWRVPPWWWVRSRLARLPVELLLACWSALAAP